MVILKLINPKGWKVWGEINVKGENYFQMFLVETERRNCESGKVIHAVSIRRRIPQTSNAFQHCVTLHVVLLWLEIEWSCGFSLCLKILHFYWLVNWLGNLVLEGVIGGYTLGVIYMHTHTQDKLDKSCSALKKKRDTKPISKSTLALTDLIFQFC